MSLRDELKQERTLPVSARVDLLNLARIDLYYSTKGHYIKTMSQLVNWSVDLLCEVLMANDALDRGRIPDLASAVQYLKARGLMQVGTKSYAKRVQQKLGTALRYETLRRMGGNPADIDPRGHSELHRKDSVVPPPSIDEIVAKAQQAARDSGIIVDDEWVDESKERDKKIVEKENAPIDMSTMKFADE